MKKINNGEWIIEAKDTKDGSGDLLIPIPDEILNALGIKENDKLDIQAFEDGSITLTPQRKQSN